MMTERNRELVGFGAAALILGVVVIGFLALVLVVGWA